MLLGVSDTALYHQGSRGHSDDIFDTYKGAEKTPAGAKQADTTRVTRRSARKAKAKATSQAKASAKGRGRRLGDDADLAVSPSLDEDDVWDTTIPSTVMLVPTVLYLCRGWLGSPDGGAVGHDSAQGSIISTSTQH